MKKDSHSLQSISGTDIAKKKEYLPIPVKFTSDKPVPSVFPQWVSYIAPEHIQDIAFRDESIWAATSGGVVKYSLDEEPDRTWFGSEHNLPGSTFRCIAIDDACNVWIGGRKTGLVWWNGQQWNNIVSGFDEKQDIRCLFVDFTGKLWCCNEQGLGTVKVFDGFATWSPYDLKDLPLPPKEINAFTIDDKGNTYLGSDRGFFYKKPDFKNWDRLTIKDGLQDNKVTKLLWLNDNYLCIGTLRGISFFDNDKIEPVDDVQGCVNGLAYEPERDEVWVSTNKHIYKWNKDNIFRFSPPFFKDSGLPTSVAALNKKIWIGFEKGIVNFQPIPTKIQTPRGQDYPVGSINSIFVEENHDVWVGTNVGLWKCKSGTWMKMRQGMELDSEIFNVTQIVATPNNHIWVSSWQSGKSGALRMFKSGVEIPHSNNNAPTSSDAMCVDIHGNLLVVKNDQIYKFDNKKWSIIGAIPNQVELVQFIYIGDENSIWIGSNTGLWQYYENKWNKILSNVSINCIAQNSASSLFIGTSNGIYHYDNYVITKIDLPISKIISLCCGKNGDLYIGTTEGLAYHSNETVEVWDVWNSGLPGQVVTQLVMDNERLWIGTHLGLSQFHYKS